jgi:hypothetical protein
MFLYFLNISNRFFFYFFLICFPSPTYQTEHLVLVSCFLAIVCGTDISLIIFGCWFIVEIFLKYKEGSTHTIYTILLSNAFYLRELKWDFFILNFKSFIFFLFYLKKKKNVSPRFVCKGQRISVILGET